MTIDIPTYQQVSDILRYEPDTGKLYWLESRGSIMAGDEAGCAGVGDRYKRVKINGSKFLSHRLAWLLTHKQWPKSDILHDNQNTLDNRIGNLSDNDHSANMKNKKMYSSNKSGVMGVIWRESSKKWNVSIKVSGKQKHVGCFADIIDAARARGLAEIEYGYHVNHGKQPTSLRGINVKRQQAEDQ